MKLVRAIAQVDDVQPEDEAPALSLVAAAGVLAEFYGREPNEIMSVTIQFFDCTAISIVPEVSPLGFFQ